MVSGGFRGRVAMTGNCFGGGEGVWVILFIPRTVSKHKVQLLPSKVCAILHLLKKGVANPPPPNKFSQSIIKIKKSFWNFFNFWGMRGVANPSPLNKFFKNIIKIK